MSAMVDTQAVETTCGRPPGSPWPKDEVAAYLQISERHLDRLIAAGRVRSIRLGRRVLIPGGEVQRIANEGV